MKDEPFRVKYTSKKNCFLHLPDKFLRILNNSPEKMCLKIHYGNNKLAYLSWYNQPFYTDDSQCVGLNATYAQMLGIKDQEEVFISSFHNANSISKMYVYLLSSEEWEIMESNVHAVQSSLLDQLRVVWPGQILPVWVSKYLHFSLRVGSIEPNCQVGILEPYTDLAVLLPSEEAKAESAQYEQPPSPFSHSTSRSAEDGSEIGQNNAPSVGHDESFQSTEFNQPTSYNIWDTVKDLFSVDVPVPVKSDQQERSYDGNNFKERLSSEFEKKVLHVPYRVHPLPRLIAKTGPSGRSDALLYQPFNVFIHRCNLPSTFPSASYTVCKVTKLTVAKLDEKHAKHEEGIKNEDLPDIVQVPEKKLLSSIYAHVCIIEDVYDKLLLEMKEKVKEAVFYSQHQCVLLTDTIYKMLNLKTGSRIDISFESCRAKSFTSLKVTPCGKWDLDKSSIETVFRDYMLRLSPDTTLVLNSNTLLNLKINSTPIGDVLVQVLPEEVDYVVLDEVTLARCRIDVAESCSQDIRDVSEEDEHTSGSGMMYFGSNVKRLIDEGLSSIRMCLLLQTSLSSSMSLLPKIHLSSNILILGRLGSGKTSLAQHMCREVAKHPFYVHCVIVQCKPLKGKKVETLQKMAMQWVTECIFYQPSILFLDDIDAIAGIAASEEHTAEEAYFFRIGDMLTNIIDSIQGQNYMMVIATAPSVTKLSRSITAARGQHFFKTLLDIPELSKDDRLETMKSVISEKTELSGKDLQALDLDSHAAKAEGYVVQDIVDLVDKAVFQGWKRMCSRPCNGQKGVVLKPCDLSIAMNNNVPLSLRGVTLHKDSMQTWADVGGLTEVKRQLIEVLQWPSQYMDLFAKCPLRHQSGLLLYGAPGTGKTLLAAAVSQECGLNFISIKGPELLSKYIGASEEAVRNIFHKAQSARPCILFFDEFDSLAPRRGHDNTGVTDRVVNQLLTQLDGVESLTGVWVVAATSRPDLLDPALLRPGRLDKAILCSLPDTNDRAEILHALSRKLNLAANVDLEEVARRSEGFTGADLQAVLYTAQLMAVENQHKIVPDESKEGDVRGMVTQEQLLAALADTRPSLSPQEKMRYQRIYDAFIGSRKGKTRGLTEVSQRVTLA